MGRGVQSIPHYFFSQHLHMLLPIIFFKPIKITSIGQDTDTKYALTTSKAPSKNTRPMSTTPRATIL